MSGAALFPFVTSTLPWESGPGQWNLTVCLKATFSLTSGAGEPVLASQADGSHEDVLFDQIPLASLYSPSDFVPYKPRADILLVGHAHAPRGAPVDDLVVRLRVGDFSKALRVTGDRAWVDTPQGARASAPRPFSRVPLRYERACRKGENLAGIAAGDTSHPPPNVDVAKDVGPAETPGFGPIAPSWRAQRDPRARAALIWALRLRTTPRQGPAPANLDPGIFNCAPRDQQVAKLAPGAPIVLENLDARVPVLQARLPSLVPKVFLVDPTSGQPREVTTALDTLWIDTDREVFVVSWRGVVGIAAPKEAGSGRVVVAAHRPGQVVTFEEVDALVRAASARHGAPGAASDPAAVSPRPGSPGASEEPESGTLLLQMPAASRSPAPFPLAEPGGTAHAAPVAGAPWAMVAAAPVPKLNKLLMETLPIDAASLAQVIMSRAADAGDARVRTGSKGRTLLDVGTPSRPAAPFPLAAPAGPASSAPIAGAPWSGVTASPAPRPDANLGGTMPLGSSLAEVIAMVQAKARGAAPPAGPSVDATPPPPAPPIPVVQPVVTLAAVAAPPTVVPAPPAGVAEPMLAPPAAEPQLGGLGAEPPSRQPPPVSERRPVREAPPVIEPAPAPVPMDAADVAWRVDAPEPAPPPEPPRPPAPPAPDVKKGMYGAFSRKKA
jgi:hypothetical protein